MTSHADTHAVYSCMYSNSCIATVKGLGIDNMAQRLLFWRQLLLFFLLFHSSWCCWLKSSVRHRLFMQILHVLLWFPINYHKILYQSISPKLSALQVLRFTYLFSKVVVIIISEINLIVDYKVSCPVITHNSQLSFWVGRCMLTFWNLLKSRCRNEI